MTGAPVDESDPASVAETVIGVLWYNVFGTEDAKVRLGGQPFDNSTRAYAGSSDDPGLNAGVARFTAEPAARQALGRFNTSGELTVPVVTLHTTGDPIVPFLHESAYAAKVSGAGATDLLTQQSADRYGHCAFERRRFRRPSAPWSSESRSTCRGRAPLGRVRLGVISDTHGLLRPEVFEAFRQVDHILHAGDVGPASILDRARDDRPGDGGVRQHRRLGPSRPAAAGGERGAGRIPDRGHPRRPVRLPDPEKLHAAFPDAEIIVFGHTHRPLLTLVDVVVTVMNPGGAGARRFNLPPSVGIMELEPGIPPRARLVPLLDFDPE